MKLYDITQELLSSHVYPGDPIPERTLVSSMQNGGSCNVSALRLCAHNGTHIDAPCHFLEGGKSIHELPPETFVGECLVAEIAGELSPQRLQPILEKHPCRLLLKGNLVFTSEAAHAIVEAGVRLLGVESQSVAPESDPISVHIVLLSGGVTPLEGLVLREVPPGSYFMSALPLQVSGSDGAPCRAVLWED